MGELVAIIKDPVCIECRVHMFQTYSDYLCPDVNGNLFHWKVWNCRVCEKEAFFLRGTNVKEVRNP